VTRKDSPGKIKDVAVQALGVAVTAATSAFRLAKGTAASLLGKRSSSGASTHDAAEADAQPSATSTESNTDPVPDPAHPKPVNVVEKLGLDPAPFDKPKPNTTIDAAADPSAVTATPADVAKTVSEQTPESDRPTE
jgi:hypothetical protein